MTGAEVVGKLGTAALFKEMRKGILRPAGKKRKGNEETLDDEDVELKPYSYFDSMMAIHSYVAGPQDQHADSKP